MVLDIRPGPIPQDQAAGDLGTVKGIETHFIVTKAINEVRREFDCTSHEAIAFICRDWMELRGVEVLSPNPLQHSTPADFKPTLLQRLQQLF